MKIMLFLILITLVSISNGYSQNGISMQNSASSSVSARIWGPEDIKKLDYDDQKSTLTIGNGERSLFYLETKLPDTLVNIISFEKVAVKCELKETVSCGVTEIKIETIFEPIICGVYTNKEVIVYIIKYSIDA